MKKVIRPIVVLVAVIAALTISALAVSPTLREALAGVLGDFAPYSQSFDGVSVTDQGIRVSVVSAIADGTQGKVYLEVADLKGDRLKEGMTLGYRDSVSYDAETRTALVEVTCSIAEMEQVDGSTGKEGAVDGVINYHLGFGIIYPTGKLQFKDVKVPWEKAGDGVLKSRVLSDEECTITRDDKTVLLPNQTPMPLEGTDLVTISSMGWDSKGTFHIQLAMAEGANCLERGVNINFDDRMWDMTGYYKNPFPFEAFVFENGKYVDFAFQKVTGYELKDILPKTVSGYVRKSTPIKGNWNITVPLQALPERIVTMSESLGRKDFAVEKLTFSAFGVRIEGSTFHDNAGTLTKFPFAIYLKDGSVVTSEKMTSGSGIWRNNLDSTGSFSDKWTFEDPVEPQNIMGVAFGMWMVPFDGDAAGPGYWLDKLPE